MSAIIWKEIRENFKWAALWMLGVTAVMAFVLYQMSVPFARNWERSLLSSEFQVITVFGAAAGAALLGLLQIVPELWRDQWAFLVHRPITRTQLFFGKVIAGLSLYAAAMLVPLFAAALWAATPGHIAAPFHWRMLLPGIADVLMGVAFYFAAILTGVRQARWYASRALPFALAILCAIYVAVVWEFWQALLGVAFSVAVLMVAAWGSFIASGQYRSQPTAAKAALAVVLLVGVSCVGILVAFAVAMLLEEHPDRTWTNYFLDKEARVLRITVGDYDNVIRSVTDLAGNPVDAYKGVPFDQLSRNTLLDSTCIRLEWGLLPHETYRSCERLLDLLSTTREFSWYFVPSEALVVGYDRKTRRRIGVIGPGGFTPPGAGVSQRFAGNPLQCPSLGEPFLALSSGVYRLDCRARQITTLLAGTPDQPIVGAGKVQRDARWTPTGPVQVGVGIATASRIHAFGNVPGPLASFDCHYPPEEYPNVQIATLPKGGYAIWYSHAYLFRETPAGPEHIVELSATGTELVRYDLPPIGRPEPIPPRRQALWALVTPMTGVIGVAAVAFVTDWLCFGYHPATVRFAQMRHEVFVTQASFWLFAGVLLLIGAVGWALAVFALTRRHLLSKRQTWWWTLAGFVLSPAGLLTVLVLREWPARITCHSCRRMRVVDQDPCGHCAAPFPPPEPTGAEIFDQAVN